MHASLQFMGAAGDVTGSRFLLTLGSRKILIDCGLFQGGRNAKEKNWEEFPVRPDDIQAVLLTHAHIDHAGYLPRLVAQGYQGPVWVSEATSALLRLLLPDAAYLQEQEAAYANKKGYSRHKPAKPLFTIADAKAALELLQPVRMNHPLEMEGVSIVWRPAGHILGSAILEITFRDGAKMKRLVVSGDLGRYSSEIMVSPTTIEEADALLIESTYGDRAHSDESISRILGASLRQAVEQKGILLIPAFAVGRTQQVLYWIRKLQDLGEAPDIPVFIDSPMAVEASQIYCEFGDDHNLEVSLLMDAATCPLVCRETRFVTSVADSKALNQMPGPAVVISASGMCNGGRILHHLKWRLPDARNQVLFVGYQAQGTLGRRLLEGADTIRIHGDRRDVRAGIRQLDALSAHADQQELLRWARGFEAPPRQVFIVHGEPEASKALQDRLRLELGWSSMIANQNGIHKLA